MESYIHLINNCQEVCFKDEQTGYTIGILSGYGAGLNRFEIPFKEGRFNLVKGYNSKEDFEKLYNSVLLVPFPNRIKDGQYVFEGKSYQLPVNHIKEQHAMHGLLFDKAFVIEAMQTENDEAHLTLKHTYQGEVEGYPFPFYCRMKYHWQSGQYLTCMVEIENTGKSALPLGLGWHPYFTFPSQVNELMLQLNCLYQYQVDERMIPTLKTHTFDAFQQMNLIADTQLDDCFALPPNGNYKTILKDDAHKITLSIEQETGQNQFSYVQIYTPENRESIAIEPMTCIPNAFNNGKGLIKLNTSEKIAVSFKLKVSIV